MKYQFPSDKVHSQYPAGSLTQRPLPGKDTGFSAGGLTREVVVSGTAVYLELLILVL